NTKDFLTYKGIIHKTLRTSSLQTSPTLPEDVRSLGDRRQERPRRVEPDQ
ncbi:Hypothetical protein FKW44_003410, partial [Caligus rogercresseyi]